MQTTNDRLLRFILDQPLFKHLFWKQWARTPPTDDRHAALWCQIQALDACLRSPGRLPASLREMRLPHCADAVVLLENGSTRGDDLAVMAAYLLRRSNAPQEWDTSDPAVILRRLKIEAQHAFGGRDDFHWESGLLRQTRSVQELLALGDSDDQEQALRSFGAIAALEVFANHHLIPGELQAFVKSGRYRVTLDDPSMRYLKNRAGEHGAEKENEHHILTALDDIQDAETIGVIALGARHFCARMLTLYYRMSQCLY